MSPWTKRVIGLLVIYGILYVLISPLPEVDATFSGKSAIIIFVLIGFALAGWLPAFLIQRPAGPYSFCLFDVLDKTCVRLC
jgi:hypothetical protein